MYCTGSGRQWKVPPPSSPWAWPWTWLPSPPLLQRFCIQAMGKGNHQLSRQLGGNVVFSLYYTCNAVQATMEEKVNHICDRLSKHPDPPQNGGPGASWRDDRMEFHRKMRDCCGQVWWIYPYLTNITLHKYIKYIFIYIIMQRIHIMFLPILNMYF